MKVVPKLTSKRKKVEYCNLTDGDCFMWDGCLCMRIDQESEVDQGAVNLESGELYKDMCDALVIPVDAKINWKHLASKKT